MNLYKINTKILLSILVPFCFLPVFSAEASTLDTISLKIDDFISFLDKNITEQIRKDFCVQYFSAISTGEWKSDEFRVKFGNKVCAGKEKEYLAVKIENKVAVGSTTTPAVEEKKDVVENNQSPEPLVDNNNLNDSLVLNDGQIVYWTNIERSKNTTKLTQLTSNSELNKIAKERVDDMFEKKYFEHISPTGDSVSTIAEKDNYKYIIIGENIALGNFGSSRELVRAWMNSEGHRANILNKNYTDIGVYSREDVYNGKKVWIAAQVFSKPMSFCIEPDNSKKKTIDKTNITLNTVKTSIKKVEDELKVATTSDAVSYNKKVTEYNSLAHTFNGLVTTIKDTTTSYNKEVQVFNECIKTN